MARRPAREAANRRVTRRGKRLAHRPAMLAARSALPLVVALLWPAVARADAGDADGVVRVLGDSRGAVGAGTSGGLVGINCELLRLDGDLGYRRDGALWSASERATLCPWSVGILDLRITQELAVGILPAMSDHYQVAPGEPYRRTGWGVELGLFDLLELVTPRLIDPATLGVPGVEPRPSFDRLLEPHRDRIYPLAFWVRYARTAQAGRTLEEEDWGFSVFRWQHDSGIADLGYVDVGAATWGDGIGVSPLTFYPARLDRFPLGPVTLDLAAGWVADGGSQSNPQFETMTPPALEGVSIVGGHARVTVDLAGVQVDVGGERTMTPYLADGDAIETRLQAGVARRDPRDRLDRIAARGWMSRVELLGANGSATSTRTWGSALEVGVPLPHRLHLDLAGELGRSFYAVPGQATSAPIIGGQVTATFSAAGGWRRGPAAP